MPHQDTSYKGLAKPALRMLNRVLTFSSESLNSSCYDRDSVPGGGLLVGILLLERTYLSYADLAAGGHRGVGHCGEPGPSLWPRGVCLHRRGHFFLPGCRVLLFS